jgi:GMP synthase-like glutamine amidotransferase
VNASDLVLVLQHQHDDSPGNLAQWLADQDWDYRVVDVETEEFPAAGRYRAIAVLGSKESAYDLDIDWIRAEHDFVGACMAAGTPVLGICFGAQLLALRLGGRVSPMGGSEIGWCEVSGPAPYGGTWFVWHGDHITAPPGSTVLAETPRCLHAYTHGAHVGVQFHPEVTAALVEDWMATPSRKAALVDAGGDADEIARRTEELASKATAAAWRLYESFFISARSERPRPVRGPGPRWQG